MYSVEYIYSDYKPLIEKEKNSKQKFFSKIFYDEKICKKLCFFCFFKMCKQRRNDARRLIVVGNAGGKAEKIKKGLTNIKI